MTHEHYEKKSIRADRMACFIYKPNESDIAEIFAKKSFKYHLDVVYLVGTGHNTNLCPQHRVLEFLLKRI